MPRVGPSNGATLQEMGSGHGAWHTWDAQQTVLMSWLTAALSNLNDHGQARVLQSQGQYWKAEVGVPGIQLFLVCNTRLAHLQLVSVVGPRHF